MNTYQMEAVTCDRNCVITACPGSGKTTVLVNKAKRILSNDQNYLIGVTFSKNSADELGERLIQLCGQDAANRFKIGTFHSLAKQQLERYYKKKLRLLASYERDLILRDLQRSFGRKGSYQDLAMKIDRFKSTTALDTNDSDYPIFLEFQRIIKKMEVYEFSDIILESIKLMQSKNMQPMYATHMLVDEFQDTDHAQYEWLKCNTKENNVITTVVGDDDQTIYGFRNAQGYTGMMQFKEDYEASLISLPINYRCEPEILKPAVRLINNNKLRVDKKIQAHKKGGGRIDLRNFATRDEEIADIVATLRASDPSQWAILSRTNKVIDLVESYLSMENIDYYRTNNESFWEKRTTGVFLATLTSLIKDDWTALSSTLHFIGVPCSIAESLRSVNESEWHIVVEKLQTKDAKKLSKVVKYYAEKRMHWRKLLDDFQINLVCILVEYYLKDYVKESELNLLKYARKVLQKMKGTLGQRIARVKQKREASNQSSGVFLSTMHGSKGLEFDHVWIMASEDGETPLKGEPIEEERRLFYVAMTRAKQHLIISYADSEGAMSQFVTESLLSK